jgi:hypothetical protein
LKTTGPRIVIPAALAAAATFAAFERWHRHWGIEGDEATRPLPGDDAVPGDAYQVTRAITVDAPPHDVFVWLQQMGSGRGGLYSYDILDRLFHILDAPSVERVLPEWQHLRAGDVIPVGSSPGFPVRAIEQDRYLVLAGEQDGTRWLWSMVLEPLPGGCTRFITRNRMAVPPGVASRVMMFVLDLAAFVMVRRWLLRIGSLAERLARGEIEGEHEAAVAVTTEEGQ